MKNFNIPGIWDHVDLNLFLLDFYYRHKEAFYDDIKISSIFGNFPFCIWDGGRNFPRCDQVTKEQIETILKCYQGTGVPLRFIFTNPEIKEEHLYNRFCNLILQLGDNGNNEVCLNSPLLEEYIRKNYPNYKIISSTTKRLAKTEDFLNELKQDKYYQVCLDYDLNKKRELIENIPYELREKCEFLINAICPAHCPSRKKHYSLTGKSQLSFLKEKYCLPDCKITNNITHPTVLGQGNNFTNEEINEYNKMGYKYFKIEGRTLTSSSILGMYLYYLVKPEWHYEFIYQASLIPGIFVNDKNSEMCGELYEPRMYTVVY